VIFICATQAKWRRNLKLKSPKGRLFYTAFFICVIFCSLTLPVVFIESSGYIKSTRSLDLELLRITSYSQLRQSSLEELKTRPFCLTEEPDSEFESKFSLIASVKQMSSDQRRDCCSWHNGVCGCSYGISMCCDGSLSPSCEC